MISPEQQATAVQNALKEHEAPTVRYLMESFLHGKDFQTAYGAKRTYYHLYGEKEPVSFIGDYHAQSELFYKRTGDDQKDMLLKIIASHRDIAHWMVPFSIAKTPAGYDFKLGHEINYGCMGSEPSFSRGFMITLAGPFKDITILQHDPGNSRMIYEQDPDPYKRHFMKILLNLLLENGLNSSGHISATGGIIRHKMILLCDHTFTIEHMFQTENRKYYPSGQDNPFHKPITDTRQPWIVDFDVLV